MCTCPLYQASLCYYSAAASVLQVHPPHPSPFVCSLQLVLSRARARLQPPPIHNIGKNAKVDSCLW